MELLEEPLFLKPVKGDSEECIYGIRQPIEIDDTTFRFNLIVIKWNNCPLMLGLEELKTFKAILNNDTCTLNLHSLDKIATVQLYTKEEVHQVLDSDEIVL